MSGRNLSFGAVFGVPLMLALSSLVGLVGALVADGLADWLGAGLLATSLVVLPGALIKQRKSAPRA